MFCAYNLMLKTKLTKKTWFLNTITNKKAVSKWLSIPNL